MKTVFYKLILTVAVGLSFLTAGAQSVGSMTDWESTLFGYLNQIREDGKAFAQNQVKPYCEANDYKKSEYPKILKAMSAIKGLRPFEKHEGLQAATYVYCRALVKDFDNTSEAFSKAEDMVPDGETFDVKAYMGIVDPMRLIIREFLDDGLPQAISKKSNTHVGVEAIHNKSDMTYDCAIMFSVIPSKTVDVTCSQWTAKELAKANVATDPTLPLTEQERLVYLYVNLARLDGQKFFSTFVEPYFDIQKADQNYYSSLKSDLAKVKGLTMLKPDVRLFLAAKEHAIEMGNSGRTGHKSQNGMSSSDRMKKYADLKASAENCDYGSSEALSIVLQLLLDENVPSVGHRKNILSDEYDLMGVSIQPHKEYRYNCVQDFGKEK